MDTVAADLAAYISRVRYEDLPEAAVSAAKRSTVDTLAAMIAGSSAPGIAALIECARNWGGKPEARIIGSDLRVPAPVAAWANGSMARALEIDDCVDFLPVHPSASSVPALLVSAELIGGLSGREFLTALAVGQDIKIRFGMAVSQNAMQSGRNNMFKIFGPTAAVARALRLDAKTTHQALGISFSHAVGDGQCALDGALSLRLQQGIVAQGALMSCLLAQKGYTGARDFLFGKYGYLRAFEPDPIMAPLTEDLGRRFHGALITIKPYSACRATHAAIDLALQLRAELGGDTERIRRITIDVSPEVDQLVGSPREPRLRPASAAAAQFSLLYTVATALARGRFFLREIEPESYTDAAVLSLAERVHVSGDPAQRTRLVIGRTRLRAGLADGSVRELECAVPSGSPERPIDAQVLSAKLGTCIEYCRRPQKPGTAGRLLDLAARLEELGDVRELLAALD